MSGQRGDSFKETCCVLYCTLYNQTYLFILFFLSNIKRSLCFFQKHNFFRIAKHIFEDGLPCRTGMVSCGKKCSYWRRIFLHSCHRFFGIFTVYQVFCQFFFPITLGEKIVMKNLNYLRIYSVIKKLKHSFTNFLFLLALVFFLTF